MNNQGQQIQIYSQKDMATKLSLMNVDEKFRNTILYYMSQLNLSQQISNYTINVIAKLMDDNNINEVTLNRADVEKLDKKDIHVIMDMDIPNHQVKFTKTTKTAEKLKNIAG